jgi:hypothetical protein
MVNYIPRVKSKDSSLKSDTAFLKLLKDAAIESAMEQAQNEIFSQNYYEPAKQKASADGVTSALGIAIYYDTSIQGGLENVRKTTKERFLQGTHTEQEWLSAFLDERKNYLMDVAESKRKKGLVNDAGYLENAASSKGRVGVLQDLVESGNLDLKQGNNDQQITLGIFGSISTIDSKYRAGTTEANIKETATEAPKDAPLDLQSNVQETAQSTGKADTKEPPTTAGPLLDRIALGEGTTDAAAQEYGLASAYDITYAYGKYNPNDSKPLTEMTIGEVKQLQQQMLANQAGNNLKSSAVG